MTAAGTFSASDAASARAHARTVAFRSGSSFLLGMRILPRRRRDAMYAIYAFCREVDDIADGAGTIEQKLAALDAWREEIERLYQGRPTRPTTRALLDAVSAFDLPKNEFLAVIDGMEMDATEAVVAPDRAAFALYCRRVAGAVGCLSIHAFGSDGPAAEELAVVLGDALQITNVLRDLDEDAARGRLYLPAELLEEAGIPPGPPDSVLDHPALGAACTALAEEARQRFAHSAQLIAACERSAVRPAILMMEVYRLLLARLERRGWAAPRRPVRVSRIEKAWIAARHGLF
ncbi:MAG: presqualene diphosphate synthase HpnD [Kiloniellales bacterium]|nr:presqualene diphosphate synthase HpnD [Kiloniellales bacterium]